MAKVYGGWPYNLAQLGREVTAGTAVSATTILRSVFGGWDDDRNEEVIEENVGVLFPSERSRITREGVTAPMPETPLTYEQFPHLLEASILTATPTGAGPYVYSYPYPLDGSGQTIKTYSIEIGNKLVTEDLKTLSYCWVEEFEISGESGGLWNMSATWQGNRAQTLANFSAATLPSVTEAPFANTLFYIDDSGGTIGSTQKTGVLMSASITVRTGIVWVPPGDGTLYPTAHKFTRPEVTGTFTYEVEQDTGVSFVADERASYEANSVRLVRLNVPGVNSNDLTIDMAIKYNPPGSYQDNDGNTTIDFEWRGVNSSADSLGFQVDVTNNLSALP